MKTQSVTVFIMLIWMTLLTGIIYPLVVTGIAQLTMRERADGSFVAVKGTLVGSELIGQKFTDETHFRGRPSATDYTTLPSDASNLGPISPILKKIVEQRKSVLEKENPNAHIPQELLYASGSGLDPHISLEAAYFQIPRIAKARGWDNAEGEKRLVALVDSLADHQRYVNVLKLNIELKLTTESQRSQRKDESREEVRREK